MISGTEMDIADISEGTGDGLVGDIIGVGRDARWFGYGWPSNWGWGGYGAGYLNGYFRGGAGGESDSDQLPRPSRMHRGYGRR